MSKVVAVARDAPALNLSLTGVRVYEPSSAEDAESRVDEYMQDKVDVLIIEETLREEFSHRMQERLAKHAGEPLIVYCPAFEDEDTDVDAYLSSVIKPAVGFEIRLT